MRKIFLIDGYNLIYRLFYAVPAFTTKAGEPVNAVFGMAKALIGLHLNEKPDYLLFIMDAKGQTFREQIYAEYKGTRDRMPDDLKAQEKHLARLLEAMNIPVLEKMGYEADDVIGTLVTRLRKDKENDIYILSGDKDLYQFINGNVAVYDTMKRQIMHSEQAVEKFGVGPEHVVDYLAITGDSSDNIPGIPGFGPKKAQSLIGEFGSLESIYENLDKMPEKTRAVLETNREVAFLSKKLASIDTNVPIEPNFEEHAFRSRPIVNERAKELFREFEFRSLLPDEDHVLGNFESLGIAYERVTDAGKLDELDKKIREAGKASIAVRVNGGALSGIAFQVGGDGRYFIDVTQVFAGDFLRNLLDSDVEIVGYDLKEDLKILFDYLDNAAAPASGQLGIF